MVLFVGIMSYPLFVSRRKSKITSGPTSVDRLCEPEFMDKSVQTEMEAAVIKPKIAALESEVGNGRWGVGWLDRGNK